MKAQVYTYISLVEEGARWSYAAVRRVSLIDLEANYSTYQLKGDTTINGLSYKKILDCCSGDYLATMREDNHRVYIIKGQEIERLFFDFNLQGDLLKKFPAPSSGLIEIKGLHLHAGMYVYTLVVDGQPVDSKRMILTK